MLRAALLASCAVFFGATGMAKDVIASAKYTDPTMRYDHGILGDAVEYGALVLTMLNGERISIQLPESRVFEDIAPRVVDLDGDGAPEVIAIETSLKFGARLSVYGASGLIAATPHIGRSHRWLAPIGAADLDGDGIFEIAYIDRPHLAKLLKIWRFKDGKLALVAERDGLTNHRIGQDFISGGIRDCGAGPQMITANADWSQIVASVFDGGEIRSAAIGKHKGRNSFKRALDCRM